MFEQTMVDGVSRRNPWSFAVSITLQSALVGAVLTLPLMHVAKLDARLADVVFLPRPIGRQEPIKQATRSSTSTATAVTQLTRAYKPFEWPRQIPNHVATGPDLPDAPVYAINAGGGGGGSIGIDLPGVAFLEPKAIEPPPEPARHAQPAPAQPAVIRVGGGVQAAKLVFGPKPAYPPLAKQARIAGTVRLAATISPDGHIRDLRVISGHPMLVSAALEAVSRWVYQPTLLNNQPVEVLTDILVNFTLNQ